MSNKRVVLLDVKPEQVGDGEIEMQVLLHSKEKTFIGKITARGRACHRAGAQ
jgi:hypothetical protein